MEGTFPRHAWGFVDLFRVSVKASWSRASRAVCLASELNHSENGRYARDENADCDDRESEGRLGFAHGCEHYRAQLSDQQQW